MQDTYDILIVGHGLAGAILARRLIEENQRVLVVDDIKTNTASRVAAGVINPITGHRLNLSEGFSDYYPYAMQCYQKLQAEFADTLYQPLTQLRLIKNPGQFEYYKKRSQQAPYAEVLGERIGKPKIFRNAAFGAVEIHQSGWLNTERLLELSSNLLQARGSFRRAVFDYQELKPTATGFEWQGIVASKVVFCEGIAAQHNPWLRELPFKPAKGAILDIRLHNEETRFLNWGRWLLPTDPQEGIARLGATYEWQCLEQSQPDQLAQLTNQLMFSLRENLAHGATQLGVREGVRPTTHNRKPFIGAIKSLPNAYCFNGFGSKGVLLIPYHANLLTAHMLHGEKLPEEFNRWL